MYCTTHPGFMYKTFLLDKIIVHFPIKILKHFIKNKGNKGSLILFSMKHYQPRASSHNSVLEESLTSDMKLKPCQ